VRHTRATGWRPSWEGRLLAQWLVLTPCWQDRGAINDPAGGLGPGARAVTLPILAAAGRGSVMQSRWGRPGGWPGGWPGTGRGLAGGEGRGRARSGPGSWPGGGLGAGRGVGRGPPKRARAEVCSGPALYLSLSLSGRLHDGVRRGRRADMGHQSAPSGPVGSHPLLSVLLYYLGLPPQVLRTIDVGRANGQRQTAASSSFESLPQNQ
jgi:hypothetical protein